MLLSEQLYSLDAHHANTNGGFTDRKQQDVRIFALSDNLPIGQHVVYATVLVSWFNRI